MPDSHQFLSVKEAAQRIGVSASMLNKYRQAGRFGAPPSIKFGSRVLYPAAQLEAWAEQRLADATGGAR